MTQTQLKDSNLENTNNSFQSRYKSILFDKDEKIISFRNKFISKITGKKIINSMIIEMPESELSKYFYIILLCKTSDEKLIKVELSFDDNWEKDKIKAIYYTSRFIQLCYNKSKTLIKEPEIYQIKFLNYNIFNDRKITHHFYYCDNENTKNQKTIKISFVEFPKLNSYLKK